MILESDFYELLLLKVEGEKNYHLRIAAILGEVEAEVCSWLSCFHKRILVILSYIKLLVCLEHVTDGLRETAERVCPPCDYVRYLLR